MHDGDGKEYGVLRWPLKDVIEASGASAANVRELVDKGVLKGADKDAPPYVYTPKHAGKAGTPVTLVQADGKPMWYCSRFVRDEYVRQRRGSSTHFTAENQPPSRSPIPPLGEPLGDGPTSPSSATPNTTPPPPIGVVPPPIGEPLEFVPPTEFPPTPHPVLPAPVPKPARTDPVAVIEGVEVDTLLAWEILRKKKRAGPVNAIVIDALRKQAAQAGITLEEAVRACVVNGWQGFESSWYLNRKQPSGRVRRDTYHNTLPTSGFSEGVGEDGTIL